MCNSRRRRRRRRHRLRQRHRWHRRRDIRMLGGGWVVLLVVMLVGLPNELYLREFAFSAHTKRNATRRDATHAKPAKRV